jgi:hypothetical protein
MPVREDFSRLALGHPEEKHGEVSYLRLPHLHGDLLCFVAEDDLWLTSLDSPDRAWRLTVDHTKTGHPRFSPDGRHIAYTSWRSHVPEILSYWGNADTQVCGWTPDGEILAVASHGAPFSHFTWAYKISPDGDVGRKLPWGRSPTSRSPTSRANAGHFCSPAHHRTNRRRELPYTVGETEQLQHLRRHVPHPVLREGRAG